MKKYEMAWITKPYIKTGSWTTITLGSSDPIFLKYLLEEIKKISPGYDIKIDSGYSPDTDLQGGLVQCTIHKLSNKDKEINFWLIQKLLEIGWEPFSITIQENRFEEIIYFRIETSD